jgi:GNAT superfamily N-acetyltransferase
MKPFTPKSQTLPAPPLAPSPPAETAAAGAASVPATAPSATASRDHFRWVPIRSLSARHRPRILKHLLALDASDRYLRFGSVANDAQIAHYVDLIDFDSDEVLGIFNRRLDLTAMAHLAMEHSSSREAQARASSSHGSSGPASSGVPTAEFGVSVLRSARGRGYGSRLFDRAVLYARNHGVQRLIIHALTENKTMLGITRRAGATVIREGSESQAELALPEDNFTSHLEELVESTVGEIDFRIKAQALAVGQMLSALSEVSSLSMPRDTPVSNHTPSDGAAQKGAASAPSANSPRIDDARAPQGQDSPSGRR